MGKSSYCRYGNIGHYVLEALQAAPDFEIAGVVRRAGAENKPEELANYAVVKRYQKSLEGVGKWPSSAHRPALRNT